MQSYTEISDATTLQNSRTPLLNNDKTAISCNEGTTFPTTNLLLGMECYRSDQKKQYKLIDVATPIWKLTHDYNKTATDKEYVDQQDGSLQDAVDLKAPLASPALTGTPTAPTATAGTNTGQLATTQFVQSAIGGIVTVPAGVIAMWSGATTNIPAGWVLCNGANGTPDLRNRMVIGAGGNYAVGATGGATSHTTSSNGSHGHTTSSNGSHYHTATTSWGGSHYHAAGYSGYESSSLKANSTSNSAISVSYSSGGCYGSASVSDSAIAMTGDSGGHNHTLSTNTTGGHTHTIYSAGAHTHTVTTMPPYYALAFIMKT